MPAQCLAIKLKCLHRLWIGIVHGGILLDFHLGFQKCFPFSELLSILHWFGSRFLIWIGFIFPLVRGIISLPVAAFLLSPIKTLVICTSVFANYISWETDLDFLTSGNDLSCCHRSAFLAYKLHFFLSPQWPLCPPWFALSDCWDFVLLPEFSFFWCSVNSLILSTVFWIG